MSVFAILILCASAVMATIGSPAQKPFPPWKTKIKEPAAGFYIYCHTGNRTNEWNILKFFNGVSLTLNPIDADETLLLYMGNNASAVEDARGSVGILKILQYFSPWSSTKQRLSPFKDTCVGIETSGGFEFVAHQQDFDEYHVGCLIFGLLFLLLSYVLPAATDSKIRNYTCCMIRWIFWAVRSPYIMIFKFIKNIYGNTMAIFALAAGSSLAHGFRSFVRLMWYLLVSIIYACDSLQSVITKKKITLWGLLLIGHYCIYHCSELEGAFWIIIIPLWLIIVPLWLCRYRRLMRYEMTRPQIRLLTNDEFDRQGIEETTKGLAELKDDCISQTIATWDTVPKLNDPKRFAEFVSGERQHVSRDEIDLHASSASSESASASDDVLLEPVSMMSSI